MALFTLGINHRTAPLQVREQLAFHAEELRRALSDLMSSGHVHEAPVEDGPAVLITVEILVDHILQEATRLRDAEAVRVPDTPGESPTTGTAPSALT